MEKRTMAKLTAIFLTLALIFAGTTVYFVRREKQYELYAELQNRKQFSQLLGSLDKMETALEKAKYLPDGAMRQVLAADLWKESEIASKALASLPLSGERPEALEQYVSQVGDYAYYLLRADAYQRGGQKEWETLCSLVPQAEQMLAQFALLKEQVDTGCADFRTVCARANAEDGVNTAVTAISKALPEYASLIYDGPYSDHISRKKPLALTNKREISQEEARQIAAKFLSVEPGALADAFASEGQIPSFGFRCGTRTVTVSRQGGMVLALTDSRPTKKVTLTPDQAVEKARAFLQKHGFAQMTPSYHTIFEAVVTANFAAIENNVTAYPDLIKVGVALDNGEIVRLDASGYAMNHHERDLPRKVLSEDELRQSVPPSLTIRQEHDALIPTAGLNEVFCREYICETEDNTHALLYLNRETGQAEDLLLLIENENGTLTR